MIIRPPPPGAPAMIYTRVACRPQEPDKACAQETGCRALVEAHDLKCVGIRCDVGVSSRAATRPGLQDVLQLARAGTFKVLVVASADRLTRSPCELEHILSALNSAGVSVLTMDAGLLTAAPGPARPSSIFQQVSLRGLRQASARPNLSPKLARSLHAAYATGKSTQELCESLNGQGVQSPRA